MLPAFGLYSHIRANRIRSAFLLAGLFPLGLSLAFAVALLMRGWSGGLPAGATPGVGSYLAAAAHDLLWLGPLAMVGTALWMALAFRIHQSIINAATGSESVTREEQPRLYDLVEDLCIARGLAMPRLRVMESEALNAFASGLRPDQTAITVTTGLLAALDEAELEAVLAHELTHIRNDDVRTMTIAAVVTGILSFAGELIFRAPRFVDMRSSGGSDKKKGGAAAAIAIAVVIMIVVWLLSQLIKFALSRSREYLADAGSVELTKNPDAMISALAKIRGRGELEGVPSGIMELCVDNPRSGFVDLFSTHPSIDARIAALARYAGGHVPPAEDAASAPPPLPADAPSTFIPPPQAGAPLGATFLPGPPPLPRA